MAAYTCLEDGHRLNLKMTVKCASLLENPSWRRQRGFWCEDDAVPSGLSVGGVCAVAALSVWGVHELFRRLKLMWGKDIEANPGPQNPQELPDNPRQHHRPQTDPDAAGVFHASNAAAGVSVPGGGVTGKTAPESTRGQAAGDAQLTTSGAVSEPGRVSEGVFTADSTASSTPSGSTSDSTSARLGLDKNAGDSRVSPHATNSGKARSEKSSTAMSGLLLVGMASTSGASGTAGTVGAGAGGMTSRHETVDTEGTSMSDNLSTKGHIGKRRKSKKKKSGSSKVKESGRMKENERKKRVPKGAMGGKGGVGSWFPS